MVAKNGRILMLTPNTKLKPLILKTVSWGFKMNGISLYNAIKILLKNRSSKLTPNTKLKLLNTENYFFRSQNQLNFLI